MSVAAGIIPYNKNGELSFLLGLEKHNGLWSGFVGGHEPSDLTIENTAIREFNEETTGVFGEYLPYIKQNLNFLVKDISPTKRNVYLYFVEFPKVEKRLKYIPRKECQEKTNMRWFTLSEIKKSKLIFPPLKKTILRTF